MDKDVDINADIHMYFVEEGMAMDIKGEAETLFNMLSSAAAKMINDVSDDEEERLELLNRFNTTTMLKLLKDEA